MKKSNSNDVYDDIIREMVAKEIEESVRYHYLNNVTYVFSHSYGSDGLLSSQFEIIGQHSKLPREVNVGGYGAQ